MPSSASRTTPLLLLVALSACGPTIAEQRQQFREYSSARIAFMATLEPADGAAFDSVMREFDYWDSEFRAACQSPDKIQDEVLSLRGSRPNERKMPASAACERFAAIIQSRERFFQHQAERLRDRDPQRAFRFALGALAGKSQSFEPPWLPAASAIDQAKRFAHSLAEADQARYAATGSYAAIAPAEQHRRYAGNCVLASKPFVAGHANDSISYVFSGESPTIYAQCFSDRDLSKLIGLEGHFNAETSYRAEQRTQDEVARPEQLKPAAHSLTFSLDGSKIHPPSDCSYSHGCDVTVIGLTLEFYELLDKYLIQEQAVFREKKTWRSTHLASAFLLWQRQPKVRKP